MDDSEPLRLFSHGEIIVGFQVLLDSLHTRKILQGDREGATKQRSGEPFRIKFVVLCDSEAVVNGSMSGVEEVSIPTVIYVDRL